MTGLASARADAVAWSFRATHAGCIVRSDTGEASRRLEPGEVRMRYLAGGICGSDIGALASMESGDPAQQPVIAPLHEVVGEIVETRDSRLACGQTVVGTGLTGLASVLVERADRFIVAPPSLSPVQAVAVQSISTVVRAVATLPEVAGSDVTVLGTGPIGLSFIHVLKRLGARRVVAVDPVIGRSMVAMQYGADEFFGCTGQQWAADAQSRHGRPAIVIDAVGRQPDLIRSALTAVSDGGFVLGFGGAGEGDYPIPFSEMYHRNLTLASGRTREGWVSVLEKGAEYLAKHASDFDGYISHQFTVDDAPRAYDLCSRPDEERVKVAVVSTP